QWRSGVGLGDARPGDGRIGVGGGVRRAGGGGACVLADHFGAAWGDGGRGGPGGVGTSAPVGVGCPLAGGGRGRGRSGWSRAVVRGGLPGSCSSGRTSAG